MSASLVGSEMCIRDSSSPSALGGLHAQSTDPSVDDGCGGEKELRVEGRSDRELGRSEEGVGGVERRSG
eukprot:3885279-Alexandrium_andersonii.AAC.1